MLCSIKKVYYLCMIIGSMCYWKMPAVHHPKRLFAFSEVCHSNKLQFFKLFQEMIYRIKQPVMVLLVSLILYQRI